MTKHQTINRTQIKDLPTSEKELTKREASQIVGGDQATPALCSCGLAQNHAGMHKLCSCGLMNNHIGPHKEATNLNSSKSN
jgi:hypothetical protein